MLLKPAICRAAPRAGWQLKIGWAINNSSELFRRARTRVSASRSSVAKAPFSAFPPRAHARKRVLLRPSASCLWGISCVPEARPLQDVNRVSMIHLATLLPPGFPKGPAGPFWPCGRRVGIGGGFSVPFWRQKGTCNASRPAGAGFINESPPLSQISQAALYRPLKRKSPPPKPNHPSRQAAALPPNPLPLTHPGWRTGRSSQ